MSLIQDNSEECSTAPFELFQVSPTQTAVEKSYDVEYHPVAPIRDGAPIEYHIPASTDEYMDLNNSRMYMRCRILNADGTDIDLEEVAAPVNDMLNSVFSNAELYMNDELISHSNNLHGHASILAHLMHDSVESAQSERSMQLIYKDTPGQMNVVEARLPNPNELIPGHDMKVSRSAVDNMLGFELYNANELLGNQGLHQRYLKTRGSQPVELLGKLRIDMFEQERCLPSGVGLKLRFYRQKDAFVLMSPRPLGLYKVRIEEAFLLIRRVRPAPGVKLGHADTLKKMSAKFPITRKECKSMALPRGLRSWKQDNIFLGQLPKRVVVAMVDSEAMSGSYTENPYNFQHFDVSYMQLYCDGEPVHTRPLKPSVAADNYIHCYETLYRGLNRMDGERSCIIKRPDWSRGYSLFAFDLTADMDADDHYSLIRHGNLRLEIEFAAALPQTIDLLFLAEFDNVIEITEDRHVQRDYV